MQVSFAIDQASRETSFGSASSSSPTFPSSIPSSSTTQSSSVSPSTSGAIPAKNVPGHLHTAPSWTGFGAQTSTATGAAHRQADPHRRASTKSSRSVETAPRGHRTTVPSPSASLVLEASTSSTIQSSTTCESSTEQYTVCAADLLTNATSKPTTTATQVPTHVIVVDIVRCNFKSHFLGSGQAHTIHKPHSKWPFKPPPTSQQLVSVTPTSLSITTQATESGYVVETTMTLESIGPESLVPVPTTTSSNAISSDSNSPLPMILGPVLGILALVALGVVVSRCRARRRHTGSVLLSPQPDPESSWERTMIEEVPETNPFSPERRIASYGVSSTPTPENTTYMSIPSQSSNDRISDPFADGSGTVSLRMSLPPPTVHPTDGMSMDIASVADMSTSVGTEMRTLGDLESLDTGFSSSSSLELEFVSPLAVMDASLSRSQFFSPTGHYEGRSALSSSRHSSSPPNSARAGVPPFPLETRSARLRLHALLREARRI
ncbi:hypothetical protein BU15DRAFT_69707 [Melanogaster broomeanus]|nr:hypothetical protein BU15DRAFT_69707 [Melanogaster broomeanus]